MKQKLQPFFFFWHTLKKSHNPSHSTGSIDVDCVHLLEGFNRTYISYYRSTLNSIKIKSKYNAPALLININGWGSRGLMVRELDS